MSVDINSKLVSIGEEIIINKQINTTVQISWMFKNCDGMNLGQAIKKYNREKLLCIK